MTMLTTQRHASQLEAILGNGTQFIHTLGAYSPVPVFMCHTSLEADDSHPDTIHLPLNMFVLRMSSVAPTIVDHRSNESKYARATPYAMAKPHEDAAQKFMTMPYLRVVDGVNGAVTFEIDLNFYDTEEDPGGIVASHRNEQDYPMSQSPIGGVAPDSESLHLYCILNTTKEGRVTLMSEIHLFAEFDAGITNNDAGSVRKMFEAFLGEAFLCASSAVGFVYVWTVQIPKGDKTDEEFARLLRDEYWLTRAFYLPKHTFHRVMSLRNKIEPPLETVVEFEPDDDYDEYRYPTAPPLKKGWLDGVDMPMRRLLILLTGVWLTYIVLDVIEYKNADYIIANTIAVMLGYGLVQVEREVIRLRKQVDDLLARIK